MTLKHLTTIVSVAALGATLGRSHVAAQSVKDALVAPAILAKDIFYHEAESPGPARLALKYKILLNHGGEITEVPGDFAFRSGDRFRIAFQGNMAGHMYLLHKGSTGVGRFLFPDPRINSGTNSVPAYCEHVVPASGWFEFDGNPGTETIHIIQATKPLQELQGLVGADRIPPSRLRRVVDTLVMNWRRVVARCVSKDIVYVDEGQVTVAPPREPEAPSTEAAVQPAPAAPVQPTAGSDKPESAEAAQPSCQATSPSVSVPAAVPGRTTQTFVAQVTAPAGAENMLVHTITLKHE